MSFISRTFSAFGKLIIVGVLLAAFLGGMAGVVYMSLIGSEIKVPEIIGKDFVESEKELAALGLKIRKRADRVSDQQMNTVLEQLPKAGETVKTGQWISVVVSKAGLTSEETPPSLKDIEDDDSEKIEEMISDKPKKKTNSNTNKKKADTTRDVIANTSTSTSNSASDTKVTSDSKPDDGDKKPEKPKDTGTAPKPQNSPSEKPKNERR